MRFLNDHNKQRAARIEKGLTLDGKKKQAKKRKGGGVCSWDNFSSAARRVRSARNHTPFEKEDAAVASVIRTFNVIIVYHLKSSILYNNVLCYIG